MIIFAHILRDNNKRNIIIMSNKTHSDAPIAADEVLSKSEALILKYKNIIIAAIAAVVIIMVGSMAYNTYVAEPQEKEAAEAMYIAESLFAAQDFEKAIDGDGVNLGFLQIADEYGSTAAGNLAHAYAGMALAQLGRYEEAIDELEAFDADDQIVAPAAMGTLGSCYAQTGDSDAAAKYFVEAAEMADNNSLSPFYLLQAGNIYEQQGNSSKALKLYEQIKNDYSTSSFATDIDKYINRVK